MTAVDDIRQARDTASAALEAAFDEIGDEIARTTTSGSYLNALINRHKALQDQLDEIDAEATDAVLSLPSVIEAATQLGQLSDQMDRIAKELPDATTDLTKITAILSLGQQFTALLASAQKKS